MKMLALMLTLNAFAAVVWESVSPHEIPVKDAMTTTIAADDNYENGAYAVPVASNATKMALLKDDENGAYDAPAIELSAPSRPTD